jgi:ChpA-C
MIATRKAAFVLATAALATVAGAGVASADSGPIGITKYSGGVLSGNNVQIPIRIASNFCGNTFNFFSFLNPAIGNECEIEID